jgi:hypothetical protein
MAEMRQTSLCFRNINVNHRLLEVHQFEKHQNSENTGLSTANSNQIIDHRRLISHQSSIVNRQSSIVNRQSSIKYTDLLLLITYPSVQFAVLEYSLLERQEHHQTKLQSTSTSATMRLTLALSILLLETTSSSAFTLTTSSTRTTFVGTSYSNGRTFRRSPHSPLFGILDEIESDQYNLLGAEKNSENKIDMNNAYEMFLADLVFSTNDPRVDIINDFERATDPTWLAWLDAKIDDSKDPEERIALRDLYEMIVDIQKTYELSRLAEERMAREAHEAERARIQDAEAAAREGRKMTNADVLKMASGIDAATALDANTLEEKKKTFYEQELTPEIRMSYEKLLKNVMPPYKAGDTYATIVFKYYDQFDAQFVKVLNERAENSDEHALGLVEALALEQQQRIMKASEALKSVLAMGDPMRMEGAIIKMAREGKVDEPFLLLLEANSTQARDAGALGAAQLMDKLRARALEEKDKQASSKEIRLIRQLLRATDSAGREKILEDAFTPREVLLVSSRTVPFARVYAIHSLQFFLPFFM